MSHLIWMLVTTRKQIWFQRNGTPVQMVFWYKICVIRHEMTLEFNRFYFVFRMILQNVPNRSHLPWSVSPGSIQNSLRMRDGKDTETLCLDVLGGCVRNPSNIGFGDVPYALVYSIYPFVFCKFHSFPKCNRSHRQKDNECQSKCLIIKDQCC